MKQFLDFKKMDTTWYPFLISSGFTVEKECDTYWEFTRRFKNSVLIQIVTLSKNEKPNREMPTDYSKSWNHSTLLSLLQDENCSLQWTDESFAKVTCQAMPECIGIDPDPVVAAVKCITLKNFNLQQLKKGL
jgi:hypothetical protein